MLSDCEDQCRQVNINEQEILFLANLSLHENCNDKFAGEFCNSKFPKLIVELIPVYKGEILAETRLITSELFDVFLFDCLGGAASE